MFTKYLYPKKFSKIFNQLRSNPEYAFKELSAQLVLEGKVIEEGVCLVPDTFFDYRKRGTALLNVEQAWLIVSCGEWLSRRKNKNMAVRLFLWPDTEASDKSLTLSLWDYFYYKTNEGYKTLIMRGAVDHGFVVYRRWVADCGIGILRDAQKPW